MKKGLAILMTVILILSSAGTLIPAPIAAASSYFSHNPALNGIFNQMEKQFLQYPNDEVVPLKSYIPIGNEEDKKDTVKRTVKKITAAQRKAAVERKLNEIRAMIEIKEEELGGLTAQDYQTLIAHISQQLLLGKGSEFGWNTEGTKVSFYLNVNDDGFYSFPGLVGNFARMGKEKDQVVPADLQVKSKIERYLHQAMDKGNKIGADVLKRLPGEVEKAFVETQPSHMVALRTLSIIHDSIFNPDYYKFDGSESVEDLADSIGRWLTSEVVDRNKGKELEYYTFPADAPSDLFRDYIVKRIVDDELDETFHSGFRQTITRDELAKLYFGNEEWDERFVIEDPAIPADSPDYIKLAYAYGMLDDGQGLDKPLTRIEAARLLVKALPYSAGYDYWLRITDAAQIPSADQQAVAFCINGGGMFLPSDKFEPQAPYTREQAIEDSDRFSFRKIRGYNILYTRADKIVLGKNTVHLLFEDKAALANYIDNSWDDTKLNKVKNTGSYMKVDTGGAVIEINTPENGIKFTMKTGVGFYDMELGYYGPSLAYAIEPKIVKATDKPAMTLQPDSINKKLNPKLDAILAKIFKPGMTDEQKVKAIHDYIVTHVTYDRELRDAQTVETILITLDKGRGVCGDYALLFMYLCRRANIPCVSELSMSMDHAWNSVFVNGDWLFVDTTWDDDDKGPIKYTYFLKDKYTFMKSHYPIMGVPEPQSFRNLDRLKLKSQDEIRAYLLQNFYWVDGFKLSFGVTDKKLKPSIPYLRDPEISVNLTYDAKTNLYTVSAKAK